MEPLRLCLGWHLTLYPMYLHVHAGPNYVYELRAFISCIGVGDTAPMSMHCKVLMVIKGGTLQLCAGQIACMRLQFMLFDLLFRKIQLRQCCWVDATNSLNS